MIRARWAVALVGIALTGACGNDAAQIAPANGQTAPVSASLGATTLPSPSLTMSREKACQQVVEGATDFVYLAAQASEDPTLEGIAPGDAKAVAKSIRDALPYLDPRTANKARELTYPLDMIYGAIVSGDGDD